MCRPDPRGVSINGLRATYSRSFAAALVQRDTKGLMPSYPGRRWVIGSLVCAGLALAVTPVVFGPLGVVAGFVAAWKGAKWWATVAVSASFLRRWSECTRLPGWQRNSRQLDR